MSRLRVRVVGIGLSCSVGLAAMVMIDVTGGTPGRATAAIAGSSDPILDNMAGNGGLHVAGASPAAQWDTTTPFRSGAADDFVLPVSPLCTWTVSRMTWTGQYWGDGAPGSISGFEILFWPDHDGMPAGGGALTPDDTQALTKFTIAGSAGETANAAGSGMFDYAAALDPPLELLPGERYWVEVRAMADFPPQWGWQVTGLRTGAGPHHYFDLLDLRAWMPIADTGDLAFALYGTPSQIDCDDQDACTVDSCAGGTCAHEPLGCDDGDACTEDVCDAAIGCTFTTVSCDDGDACTTDTCDAAQGCLHQSMSCDDQSACTTDTCDPETGCVFTSVSCDDGDACTTDSCDDVQGCRHATVTCNDHSACTTDSCDPTTGCVFTDVSCDDGDPCTTDACDAQGGCTHEPIICDDQSACTDDACVGGVCSFTPISCDDGDACTTDSCDPAGGCAFVPMECDDGDVCTTDHCVDGVCTSGTRCDFDGDGDVDEADFVSLYACLGSAGTQSADGACACMDLNGDGAVDLGDFGVFQMEFSGAK